MLTLWAVLETQRIEAEARRKQRQEMERANQQIEQSKQAILAAERRAAQMLGAVAARDLRGLCAEAEGRLKAGEANLYRKELRTQNKWEMARQELVEGRTLCHRIVGFAEVTEEEKRQIHAALQDLDSTIRHLGKLALRMESQKHRGSKPAPRQSEAAPADEGTAAASEKPQAGGDEVVGEGQEEALVLPVQVLIRLVASIHSRTEQNLYE